MIGVDWCQGDLGHWAVGIGGEGLEGGAWVGVGDPRHEGGGPDPQTLTAAVVAAAPHTAAGSTQPNLPPP